ncbi:MAG: hypothetical protein WCP74_13895, partial [Sphingobacteriia bacterium]
SKWDNQIFIKDVNGRPMTAKYIGVDGTPYLFKEFKFGSIELKNGRKFTSVQLKLDLVAQEIIFLSPDKEEGEIGSEFVKEVLLTDTTELGVVSYLLRSGFPAVDNYKSNQFCLVIAEGKIALLKSMVKTIDTRKNELSGEISKEFALTEEFFTFQNGVMTRFKRDKDNILSVMADKRAVIEKYLKENKGNFKNSEYLAKIFTYYNIN